ncbi:MAG TPA: DNA polymerase Y family protein [Candidatus Acidoferrum sp.]|jgi:protein ImuB
MAFAAIFVPNFRLQAVVRCEPELAVRPIALIDGSPPTYQVVAVNRLAARLGVAEGMTKAAAAQFPGVEIRPRGELQETTAHAVLLDVAWSFSPRMEATAADTVLIDLDGLTTLFGAHENIAASMVAKCVEMGLTAQVAIAANVGTATVVARALPGATVVPEGQEAKFLESLPVQMLSLSEELCEVFERWGVKTCKALASLPVISLSECVGQEGVRVHAIASGNGVRSLVIAEPAHCFEEFFELEDAVEDLEPLSFLLGRLLDQLCARLAARSLAVRAIHLHFTLQPSFESAFDSCGHAIRKEELSSDYVCAIQLPVPCRDAKLLLKLVRLRLQSAPPHAPVQKIHMLAEPSFPRVTQGGLFVLEAPDPEKLELTIARIAHLIGEGNVGSPQLMDSHRPDSFRMHRFSAAPAQPIDRDEKTETKIAFRAFRPPVLTKVNLRGGRPTNVAFLGRSGEVVHTSGPWRTSGDWWEEDPWQQDAWDVEVHFPYETPPSQGFYRICFDSRQKKWLVLGAYD